MNNKGRGDTTQSSQTKGKETISVELSGDVQSKAKKSSFNNQESKFPPKSTPSKTIRWLQYFIYSIKGVN